MKSFNGVKFALYYSDQTQYKFEAKFREIKLKKSRR